MIYVIGMLLGTLATTGIIRAFLLYLFKKIDHKKHWVWANIGTAVLRSLVAIPELLASDHWIYELLIIFVIYVLEQLVWVVYDLIQQKRQDAAAGWGLIWGIILGGFAWLFVIKLLLGYISNLAIAA